MVACDVYRPAAIKQLQVVGSQLNIPVFAIEDSKKPVEIAKESIKFASSRQHDLVIIDTAGRLHIDDELMGELQKIKAEVKPTEILLVVDSMTGQDAVNVASTFNEKLDVSGVILTKLDGDTRGGAALSVKAVTGKPIKFAATGEKLSDMETFYPDRMASRILGMGDVLSLIEKAQESFDEKKAMELEKRMRTNQFTFEDFLDQMQQMKNMGGIGQILSMMPGGNKLANMDMDEKRLVRMEAIIQSMTKKERINPTIINASRRIRIAKGSGTEVSDVNKLLKEFEEMKKMMKMFTGGKQGKKGFGKFKLPF
jgi:signal recognition particle subunit SRP54